MAFNLPDLPHEIPIPEDVPVIDVGKLKMMDSSNQGPSNDSEKVCEKGKEVFVLREKLNIHTENQQKMFRKEVTLLRSINHENIIKFHSIVRINDSLHSSLALLMEYAAFDFSLLGKDYKISSLAEFLSYLDRVSFDKFEHLNAFIAKDVASGLDYLHKKDIVHRDLKPSNIRVSNQHYSRLGEAGFKENWDARPIVAKLTDFGEARGKIIETATEASTMTDIVDRGSAAFRAPEVICGDIFTASREDLKHIDVWSFGMLLFVLLNPDLQYPYEVELRENSRQHKKVMLELTLRELMKQQKNPRHSVKYQNKRENAWSKIVAVYEACAKFRVEERPTMKQVLDKYFLA